MKKTIKIFSSFVLTLLLASSAFSYTLDNLKCECYQKYCTCYEENSSDNSFLVFCASQKAFVCNCQLQASKIHCACYVNNFKFDVVLDNMYKFLDSYCGR
ncbi:MAG: hypothetical protein ACP5QP_03750 [Brevinematia bacterium]